MPAGREDRDILAASPKRLRAVVAEQVLRRRAEDFDVGEDLPKAAVHHRDDAFAVHEAERQRMVGHRIPERLLDLVVRSREQIDDHLLLQSEDDQRKDRVRKHARRKHIPGEPEHPQHSQRRKERQPHEDVRRRDLDEDLPAHAKGSLP